MTNLGYLQFKCICLKIGKDDDFNWVVGFVGLL